MMFLEIRKQKHPQTFDRGEHSIRVQFFCRQPLIDILTSQIVFFLTACVRRLPEKKYYAVGRNVSLLRACFPQRRALFCLFSFFDFERNMKCVELGQSKGIKVCVVIMSSRKALSTFKRNGLTGSFSCGSET